MQSQISPDLFQAETPCIQQNHPESNIQLQSKIEGNCCNLYTAFSEVLLSTKSAIPDFHKKPQTTSYNLDMVHTDIHMAELFGG